MDKQKRLSIKSWSIADRPREKLTQQGARKLSDTELLAILIGSGNKQFNALEIAQLLMASVDNQATALANATLTDFQKLPGIGIAKAISLMAIIELGRRIHHQTGPPKRIICSHDAYTYLRVDLEGLGHEEFWIILLNQANHIIRKEQISKGGVNGVLVDSRRIFHTALQHEAVKIILAHNHPSGNLKASEADRALTQKLKKSGLLLDIPVVDHLIIGKQNYLSFADEGLL